MTPNSSLLQWLATFQLGGESAVELKNDAYYNLADGYVCARILNQISPLYFTDKWLDGIKPVAPNGSWRLRVSNLKRILQKIHDYASDLQSSQFMLGAINPDVTVIAQNFDPDQISRLIQLILFCAINCEKKQIFIEKIRDLPTQVKQDIKEAIEELLVKNSDHQQPARLGATSVGLDDSSTSSTAHLADGDLSSRLSTSQRFNLSTTSSSTNILNSPGRSSATGAALRPAGGRRDSSQSDIYKRSESSHLDVSGQSVQSVELSSGENLDTVRRRLSEALRVVDQRAQSCHELELKVKHLELERSQLQYENEKLLSEKSLATTTSGAARRRSSTLRDQHLPQETIATSSSGRNLDTSQGHAQANDDDDNHNSQNRRLQIEIQRLERELNRVETEKEDFRLKANLLSEDLDRITLRHEELKSKAEHAKRLQDELDEHKHISEKVISYETMVEGLVKKNSDMKKELKCFEDKNLEHIQKIVRLEQENQQLESSVSSVEIYKKQLSEVKAALAKEAHRADKAEVDLARLSDKLDVTKRENEKLLATTSQLMRSNNLRDKQQSDIYALNKPFESVDLKDNKPTSSSSAAGASIERRQSQQRDPTEALDSLSTPPVIELKERLARLEMENQLLQAKVSSKVEQNKSVLGGLLDEATEKCKRLEDENRQFRKRTLMLESNLKELTQGGGGQPSTSGPINQIQDSSSDNTLALIKRVEDLQRSLYQRDQELRDAEARYKKNISKAKEVIKSLNSNQQQQQSLGSGAPHPSCMSSVSFNSSSLDETNLLRQQLREREERIIDLEREFHEFKKLKEVHERLILSAFYGLTTPMQWKNAERRLEQRTLTSPTGMANGGQMSKNQ